ncbi:hypothetical protein LTR51_008412 [Lithohypha guttulata]|nr:hypothetical protein LTR51_008412 [Lithohypha guttulata]
MQIFATVATFALAACGVAASPTPSWGNWGNSGNPNCVSRSYIEGLIAQEIVFLQHKNVTAAVAAGNAIFDANIAEYGDSINSLRGAPTTSTPPIPQIDTLSLTVDCNQYVWQWRFYGIGPGPNPYIQGITLGKINAAGKIYYQYVEFNSLAWAENSGYKVTPPTSGPYAAPSA